MTTNNYPDDRGAIEAGAFNNPGYKRIYGTAGNLRVRLTRGEQAYIDWLKQRIANEHANPRQGRLKSLAQVDLLIRATLREKNRNRAEIENEKGGPACGG